ncbi:hypothetical protein COLO4_23752 [Corchorus olitorius]|uniref:TF-B3 domain-containing protein n=1 Tax=Corchorus olitorius TaxID=93759 RepID=A0A1R3IF44_9ROSI|nr:hypothetical protein COLO4_23752 [Corchorus olitorius]
MEKKLQKATNGIRNIARPADSSYTARVEVEYSTPYVVCLEIHSQKKIEAIPCLLRVVKLTIIRYSFLQRRVSFQQDLTQELWGYFFYRTWQLSSLLLLLPVLESQNGTAAADCFLDACHDWIMDAKMDSGIVCRYHSIDEAIESGAAPILISLDLDSIVDVQCTIDIMDHLLACELKIHECHEAWMSLAAANEQPQKVRLELTTRPSKYTLELFFLLLAPICVMTCIQEDYGSDSEFEMETFCAEIGLYNILALEGFNFSDQYSETNLNLEKSLLNQHDEGHQESVLETERENPNKENDQEENSADRLNQINQEAGDSQSVQMGVEGLNHINQEEEADHQANGSVEIMNQTPPSESKTEKKCLRRSKRTKTASDKNKNVPEDVSDNDSVEIMNHESKMGKKRQREEHGLNASAKKLNQTPLKSKTEKKSRLRKKQRKTTSDKNKISDEVNGNSTPLQQAAAFQTDNPFFVVEMQPSYINPGYILALPIDFITKHLPNSTGNVTFCAVDGKEWNARYFAYKTNNKYSRASISNGWHVFVRDNELKPGDACVFELTDQSTDDDITLNVVIYRVKEDSNCSSSSGAMKSSAIQPLTSHEKATALLRASQFESINPHFKVVMQPAYLKKWRLDAIRIPIPIPKSKNIYISCGVGSLQHHSRTHRAHKYEDFQFSESELYFEDEHLTGALTSYSLPDLPTRYRVTNEAIKTIVLAPAGKLLCPASAVTKGGANS